MLRGVGRQGIADKLGISISCVRSHITYLMQKYGIDANRFHARVRMVYLMAIEQGLIAPFAQHDENRAEWQKTEGTIGKPELPNLTNRRDTNIYRPPIK